MLITSMQDFGFVLVKEHYINGALFSIIATLALTVFAGNLLTDVKTSDSHGDAAFAKHNEIKRMGFFDIFGVVIGKSKTKIIQTSKADYSVMLLAAPPRTGKGVGTIIPTLLTYPGSFLTYDVKGENFAATARHRAANNHDVFAFAPWGVWDVVKQEDKYKKASHRFNPLKIISQIEDLEDRNSELKTMAVSFLSASTPTEQSFLGNGIDIFVAVCNAAITVCENFYDENPLLTRRYANFNDVISLLSPKGEMTVTEVLAELSRIPGLDPQTKDVLLKNSTISDKIADSYMSVLETCGLNVFRDPAVLRATSENDFDFDQIRAKPQSIYIIIPPDKQKQAAPLVRLFMQYVVKTLQKHLPDEKTEPFPVLFMIDEFHTLGKVDAIIDACTVIPAYGGRICMVVQSVESITDIYGQARKDIILDNCQLQIFMGANSVVTAEYISKALGEYTTKQRSISHKAFDDLTDRSSSFSERGQRLMTANAIQKLNRDNVIALVQNNKPILADKIRFFKDRNFKSLSDGQKKLAWPDIPIIKKDTVRSVDEYLNISSENINDMLKTQENASTESIVTNTLKVLSELGQATLENDNIEAIKAASNAFDAATNTQSDTINELFSKMERK